MKTILFAFMLVSYVSFSQKNTLEDMLLSGSWDTKIVYVENRFSHNFENDSITIYDTLALSNMNESEYLKNSITLAAKKYATALLETYQFNSDFTCTVTRVGKDVVKYTFSIDESAKKITFVDNIDKTNAFKMNVTAIDQDRIAFQFLSGELRSHASTLKRVSTKP